LNGKVQQKGSTLFRSTLTPPSGQMIQPTNQCSHTVGKPISLAIHRGIKVCTKCTK